MRLFILFLLTICCFADDKVLFLHIPKTAGTSFRSILADHYAVDQISGLGWDYENLDYPKFENRSLVMGHFFFSQVYPSISGKSEEHFVHFKKVTFLRDPVHRILSEHRYTLEKSHANTAEVLKNHLLSQSGDPIDTAANVTCLFLSKLNPFNSDIPIEAHLESAKEALATDFDFVGIVEEMTTSVTLFHQLMGWPVPKEIPVHNTTNTTLSTYSQSKIDEMIERNWADIELYRFAKKRFEQEKQTIKPWIKEENPNWVSEISYDFTGSLDGFGWCPREKKQGTTFRWFTSPEKATIHFPLKSGSAYLMEADIFIPTQIASLLAISINAQQLPVQLEQLTLHRGREYEWFRCSLNIPKTLLKDGTKTAITFTIPDPSYTPSTDSYRGRCGLRNILISKQPD